MPFCCILGCYNSQEDGKRFMRFPLGKKDGERLRVWLQLVSRNEFVPTPYSRICEDHFEDSQFETGRADGRKLLKWNAVPTIEASNNQQKRAKGKVPRRTGSEQAHDTLDAADAPAASVAVRPFPGEAHGV
ncbi:peroxynitrite isomerase THAP4-like [Haemaphysalis longicornis]